MRFRFVDAHRRRWPIEVMCRVLAVSRSGYYAWRRRPMSAQARRRAMLVQAIRLAHRASRGIYGSPRIHRDLRARGLGCGRHTVARLMRQHHLRSRLKRRFVIRTTDSRHDHAIARNLLEIIADDFVINDVCGHSERSLLQFVRRIGPAFQVHSRAVPGKTTGLR